MDDEAAGMEEESDEPLVSEDDDLFAESETGDSTVMEETEAEEKMKRKASLDVYLVKKMTLPMTMSMRSCLMMKRMTKVKL